MKLLDWTARRAGGRITVTGKDEGGKDAKIVGVDTIEPHYMAGVRASKPRTATATFTSWCCQPDAT
jgi:hypothetical protein